MKNRNVLGLFLSISIVSSIFSGCSDSKPETAGTDMQVESESEMESQNVANDTESIQVDESESGELKQDQQVTAETSERSYYEEELYGWMNDYAKNISSNMWDSITSEELEEEYKDVLAECKEFEMNIVLEHLDILHWMGPSNTEEESELPVDDFLGEYSSEKLAEYTNTEYDIQIKYIYGAWTEKMYEPYKHVNMLVEEYDADELCRISLYSIEKGYSDMYTRDISSRYRITDRLPIINTSKTARGKISGSGSIDGKFYFIYTISDFEYGSSYKSGTAFKVDCDITPEGLVVEKITGLKKD